MGKGGKAKSVGGVDLSRMSESELRGHATYFNAGIVDEVKKMDRSELMKVMEPFVDGMSDPYKNNYHKFPIEKPKFTIADLRKAIPPHCFEHSLITSFYYLIRDCVGVAVVGYLATYIDAKDGPFESMPFSSLARSAAWLFYFWLQGCIMTGLWVLAHECGHGGFSKSTAVNNTVGTIFHSLMMVPYHPWRITHAKHHQNTGSCEHDEVFAPVGRADMGDGPVRAGAIANLWGLFITFTLGWLPGYLVFNATGPIKYRGKNASHFSPDAEFFKKEREERALVYQSKIFFFVVLAGIGYACKELQTPEGPWYEGMLQVFKYYYGPLAVVNFHLVLITFLQHTDVYMPHFRGAEWDWFRGACCTIDRSYGKVQDIFFHHITDTHVVHHLFSYMPFYHASEATEHVKKVMGDYYMRDETHYLVALWRSYSTCLFVEDDEDIVFFKNKK